jgi:hypothetical protein
MATQPILDTIEKAQKYINDGNNMHKLSSTSNTFTISLGESYRLNSLEGIVFPIGHPSYNGGTHVIGSISDLRLVRTRINTLRNANYPVHLKRLYIFNNNITSLNGISFPDTITELSIQEEQIQSLEGVKFPSNLKKLELNNNRISSLKGVTFPLHVSSINLSNNQIASFDGMKFPLSLESLHLEHNPIVRNIDTIRLLVHPTEVVMREIVRNYPQTAAYFEQQRELEELNMRKLQNHVRSIAAFLQPLIAERKVKEEAKLTDGTTPRLFIVNTSLNGTSTTYSIPFTTSQTVQSAIDYLEQNYLLSVTNSYAKIRLTTRSDNTALNPLQTFADVNIQNEDTLNAVRDNSRAAVQNSRGGRIQNKTKRKRSRSRRFN